MYNTGVGGANTQDTSTHVIAALPYSNGSAAMGGTVFVSPVFQNIGGMTNPTPDLLVGHTTDFPNESPASVTVYGVSHTYMPFNSSIFTQLVNGINTNWLMRYE